MRRNLKLAQRYYGPFQVLKRNGNVAYNLDLPKESRIHLVLHVSKLKKKNGEKVLVQIELPTTAVDVESLCPTPQAILNSRIHIRKREVLIHWQGFSPAEAIWENREGPVFIFV